MSSSLFFPEEAVDSVRHVLNGVAALRNNYKFPTDPDLSAPMRLGPLEFRIATKFTSYSGLAITLQCNSVLRSFPWRGVVEAELQDASYKKKFLRCFRNRIYVSSDKELEEGGVVLGMERYFVTNDSMFLEVALKLRISVKVAVEESLGWKIPYAILRSRIPTLTTGRFLGSGSGDLSIVSKDGDHLAAHSLILEWSSPVFKTMLSTEMREKAEWTVKMGYGTKAVRVLVKFLYTGGFRDEMENLEEYGVEDFLEVVHAGGMYELPLLMKLAGVALLLRCRRENVWDLVPRLKKYREPMKETLTSLADFLQSNAHAIALE